LILYSATFPETRPILLLPIKGEYDFETVNEEGLYEIPNLPGWVSTLGTFRSEGIVAKVGEQTNNRIKKAIINLICIFTLSPLLLF
jgi:hypothetical protein